MNETRPHAPTRRSLLLRVAAALRGAAVILPPASFAQVPGRGWCGLFAQKKWALSWSNN
jgi:hypothetical protein